MIEQEKLHQAFAARKIRIQLYGSRLPIPYVLYLRLTREEDFAGRARSTRTPKTRRRRSALSSGRRTTRSKARYPCDTSSDLEEGEKEDLATSNTRKKAQSTVGGGDVDDDDDDADIVRAPAEELGDDEKDKGISATERELRELEDDEVRRTNAYTGATNSIGSVYQRRWYVSLDREASGFVKRRREGRTVWERAEVEEAGEEEDGALRLSYPFYVRGVEHERSVVTGRLGNGVLKDEGVEGYIGRKGWQAILK